MSVYGGITVGALYTLQVRVKFTFHVRTVRGSPLSLYGDIQERGTVECTLYEYTHRIIYVPAIATNRTYTLSVINLL